MTGNKHCAHHNYLPLPINSAMQRTYPLQSTTRCCSYAALTPATCDVHRVIAFKYCQANSENTELNDRDDHTNKKL